MSAFVRACPVSPRRKQGPLLAPRAHYVCAMVLILHSVSSAQPPRLSPPALGEPASFKTFGRPVGGQFEASMEAEPREVRMDSSLRLTIRVAYQGPKQERPQKPPSAPSAADLGETWNDSFDIAKETPESDGTSWQFSYRLSPKSADVSRVPALLFTYYSPLGYRTVEAAGIEIKVLPRAIVQPSEIENAAALPSVSTPVYRFTYGDLVLRREERWSLPSVTVLLAIFLAPPLLCLGWYRLWQYLYPDEARRRHRRRSRAARSAQRGLDLARVARLDLHGALAADIMTTYLRERLDLPMLEPTPHETAEHLTRLGCPEEVVTRASRFFEVCDAARFAADMSGERERVLVLASDLVRSLEQEGAAHEVSGKRRSAYYVRGSWVALLILLVGTAAGRAEELSDEALLARAETSVRSGLEQRDDISGARKAFAIAADDYEQLVQRGVRNAALFRNLGNAELLAGRLPEAIFAYRRGEALAPENSDLRALLNAARSRIRFPPGSAGRPPVEDWPPWLPRLSPVRSLLVAAGLLVAFWLALTRYRMTGRGILLLVGSLAAGVAVLLAASAMFDYGLYREDVAQPLVVIARDDVPLRKGNGLAYPARDDVPALTGGMEGRLLGQRPDRQGTAWLRIQLVSGESGWVREDEALVER